MDIELNREQVPEDAKAWVVLLARLGWAMKGVVYAMIGILSLEAVLQARSASEEIGQQDAFIAIARQPFGQVLLGFVALGLFGYGLWRVVEAIQDPQRLGSGLKGIAVRVGFVTTAIFYWALAYSAVQIILGSRQSDDDTELVVNTVMQMPFGRYLIGFVGVAIFSVGAIQFYRVYSKEFTRHLRLYEMDEALRESAIRLGQVGLVARGIGLALIGYFLFLAALQYNPDQAGGLGNALQRLALAPYGPWALGAVSIGLIAYGIYAIALARYRRIYVK